MVMPTPPLVSLPAASNRLFVGNLSWDTSRDTLGDHFESCEGFVSARVAWDMDRQRSRGFGFVEFQTPEQAEAALQVSIREQRVQKEEWGCTCTEERMDPSLCEGLFWGMCSEWFGGMCSEICLGHVLWVVAQGACLHSGWLNVQKQQQKDCRNSQSWVHLSGLMLNSTLDSLGRGGLNPKL